MGGKPIFLSFLQINAYFYAMKGMFILLLCGAFVAHDFYVSIAEIDYNDESKSLEVSVKVFADDLEKVIKDKEGITLHIGEMNENEQCGAYISAYLKEHFKITVDGEEKSLEYLGHEMEKRDAVWSFFEVFDVDQPKDVQIENSILVNEYEGQKNIVYFGKAEGRPYTLMFNKDKISESILIEQ